MSVTAAEPAQCTLLLSYDSPLQLQKESEFMEKLESKDEEIKVKRRRKTERKGGGRRMGQPTTCGAAVPAV